MRAAISIIRFGAFALVIAAVLGFALFVRAGTGHAQPDRVDGDAIVALTGGEGRVATGVALLADGHGERLLISGGNPEVTMDAIRAAAGAPPALFDCCVDIGLEAANTVGNADETARWAAGHGYQRLVIVNL